MSIREAGKGILSIETAHHLYQMKVEEGGIMVHLWYGAKTGTNMDYLVCRADRGLNGLSRNFHRMIREQVIDRKYFRSLRLVRTARGRPLPVAPSVRQEANHGIRTGSSGGEKDDTLWRLLSGQRKGYSG